MIHTFWDLRNFSCLLVTFYSRTFTVLASMCRSMIHVKLICLPSDVVVKDSFLSMETRFFYPFWLKIIFWKEFTCWNVCDHIHVGLFLDFENICMKSLFFSNRCIFFYLHLLNQWLSHSEYPWCPDHCF